MNTGERYGSLIERLSVTQSLRNRALQNILCHERTLPRDWPEDGWPVMEPTVEVDPSYLSG
jgi:hypothetical protein